MLHLIRLLSLILSVFWEVCEMPIIGVKSFLVLLPELYCILILPLCIFMQIKQKIIGNTLFRHSVYSCESPYVTSSMGY